ncbi:hypothetical protein KY362_04100 [Candidatus Woesearchaeota archaeon]|nr:hypothetical protein [Candidatus Woesearchaeota archaeon]
MAKKFWRCNVCNDVHHGNAGPEICPTCFAKNAYCEADAREAANVQGMSTDAGSMSGDDIRSAWAHFTEKNDFALNPDNAHVEQVLKGVLENDGKFGLKLCPCRLRDGTREMDLQLICPCNFKTHETWAKQGRCWCGLFVKK